DGRYTCKPFEFAIAFLDEVFVFHLGIVNLQDTFARGLLLSQPVLDAITWMADLLRVLCADFSG
ncbi:MAG: hypothetical protein ACFN9G_07275, partial [Cardiobacterium sp.]